MFKSPMAKWCALFVSLYYYFILFIILIFMDRIFRTKKLQQFCVLTSCRISRIAIRNHIFTISIKVIFAFVWPFRWLYWHWRQYNPNAHTPYYNQITSIISSQWFIWSHWDVSAKRTLCIFVVNCNLCFKPTYYGMAISMSETATCMFVFADASDAIVLWCVVYIQKENG